MNKLARNVIHSISMSLLLVLSVAPACDDGPGEAFNDFVDMIDSSGDTADEADVWVDVEPDRPPSVCEQPDLAVCETTTPAPTANEDIVAFAADNAIPLKCETDGSFTWDFDIFFDEFEGLSVFMMGEAHGSQEIGQASVALFDALLRVGMVETVAIEIGMDATSSMNAYVVDGDESFFADYGLDALGPYVFRRLFPEHLRDLYLEGIEVPIYGVDHPQRLAWVNEQLVAVADLITDETARALVIDNMPAPREIDSYGMLGLEWEYVDEAEDYHALIMENIETLCAELTDAQCEELEYMSYALYVGAVFASQDFLMENLTGGGELTPRMLGWMDEREDLIFWNFQRIGADLDGGVFAHMGAAHVSKGNDMSHVGAMLQDDFEPTRGGVYSVLPAYGPGSSIFSGFMAAELPPEPAVVSAALSSMPIENYFLSSVAPGVDCDESPFPSIGGAVMGLSGASLDHWDSFFWYRRLTPDTPSMFNSKSALTPNQRVALDNYRRMRMANEMVFNAIGR